MKDFEIKAILSSIFIGLNTFLYWIFCVMKSPAHEWEFIFDGTIIIILIALNMIFVPIAVATSEG